MCTVPVRNFRSKSPEVQKAQNAPLEGPPADPSPFQVMLAVLRAARPRRTQAGHTYQNPSRVPKQPVGTFERSHWNGNWAILLPDTDARLLDPFEKPRRRIKWGPAMRLGILGRAVLAVSQSSQPSAAVVGTQKPGQGRCR